MRRGTPDYNEKYDRLTFWEQLDGGAISAAFSTLSDAISDHCWPHFRHFWTQFWDALLNMLWAAFGRPFLWLICSIGRGTGTQYTLNKKFLTIIPIVLFLFTISNCGDQLGLCGLQVSFISK